MIGVPLESNTAGIGKTVVVEWLYFFHKEEKSMTFRYGNCLLVAVLSVLGVALAFGGGQPEEDVPEIALVAPDHDFTQMYGQFYMGFRNHLDEVGFEYAAIEVAPPGGISDAAGFDRVLGDMLSLQPDYLVHIVGSFELEEPRLVELQEAGVDILMVDTLPIGETDLDPIAWVITDHHESGFQTGYGAVRELVDRGEGIEHLNVALFHGTAESEPGINRMKGYQEGLEVAAEEFGLTYEIVQEVWAEFNREMAFRLSQDVVTGHYPDLDLIFAANSHTALGVMAGLENEGVLGDVEVTGIGGQIEEMAAIARGDILGASIRLPHEQGATAAELLLEYREHGRDMDGYGQVYKGEQEYGGDAASIFRLMPVDVLDVPEFRRRIPEGMWEEYTQSQ